MEEAWTREAQQSDAPIPPDLKDLVHLHQLVIQRRAMTVLEFGTGFSSWVIAHALEDNARKWDTLKAKPQIRNSYLWTLIVVDASQTWLDRSIQRIPESLRHRITPHRSDVEIGSYQGQLCHYYVSLPDVVPDFIYLDGPDPSTVQGDVRGLTFKCKERTVMAGDLLLMEPTFLPGTFILIDGRTNNARFLARNFTRRYETNWDREADVSTFDLVEPRLGPHNLLGTDILKT